MAERSLSSSSSSANLPPGVGVDATVPADMRARSVQRTPPLCVGAGVIIPADEAGAPSLADLPRALVDVIVPADQRVCSARWTSPRASVSA